MFETLLEGLGSEVLTTDVGKHVCYLVAASWVFKNENTKMRKVFADGIARLTGALDKHTEQLEDHGKRIETIEGKLK